MKKHKYSIVWQITQGFVAGAIGYGVVNYLAKVVELRPLFKAILGLHLSFPAYAIGVSWKDYSMSSLLENAILSQFNEDKNALYAALKAYRSHHH